MDWIPGRGVEPGRCTIASTAPTARQSLNLIAEEKATTPQLPTARRHAAEGIRPRTYPNCLRIIEDARIDCPPSMQGCPALPTGSIGDASMTTS